MAIPIQEERFEYKGFPCVVLFMPMGFRNGYVGLPKTNKYYKCEYDFIPIDCHCGLTYSKDCLFGQDDKDTWWIGFDCGHCCDGFDIDKIKEYYPNNKTISQTMKIMHDYHLMINKEHEFRTLDYVKENCKSIVDQLLKESED